MKKLYDMIVVEDEFGDVKLRVSDLRSFDNHLRIEIFDFKDLRFNFVYQDELVDLGYGIGSNKYKELESMFDKE
jgi:hypothetical protein